MLTQDEVKALFDYHPDGWLIWRTGRTDRYETHRGPGELAGIVGGVYLHVSIRSAKYTIHRLVWMWHHGVWPKRIDHINGDKLDNRIENLRECTPSQNAGNASYSSMRGIERHGRKWRVRISTERGKIELGSYEDLGDAMIARDAGHLDYFGDFARV